MELCEWAGRHLGSLTASAADDAQDAALAALGRAREGGRISEAQFDAALAALAMHRGCFDELLAVLDAWTGAAPADPGRQAAALTGRSAVQFDDPVSGAKANQQALLARLAAAQGLSRRGEDEDGLALAAALCDAAEGLAWHLAAIERIAASEGLPAA